jgi:hypothetical protein
MKKECEIPKQNIIIRIKHIYMYQMFLSKYEFTINFLISSLINFLYELTHIT